MRDVNSAVLLTLKSTPNERRRAARADPMSKLSVDHSQLVARARHLAGKIVDGEITPFEGATLIWRECHLKTFHGDHTFDPFVYWQDEYEDAQSEERRQRCAEIIRQVARQFLGGPEVVLDRSDLEPSISPNRKRDP